MRRELEEGAFPTTDRSPSTDRAAWALKSDGPPHVFIGDLVYSHMHAYLADGFYEQWLANIARAKRERPRDVLLMMGHGEPAAGHALLDWQADYIHRLLETLESSNTRDSLEGDALADAGRRTDEGVPPDRGPALPHRSERRAAAPAPCQNQHGLKPDA